MSPSLWPPSSWLSSRHPGPEPARFFPGMDPSFREEVNLALRFTVNANGWPDTYGRRQPQVEIAPGDTMATVFSTGSDDPFRLTTSLPVRIMVGDQFLDTRLPRALLDHGFSREQVLTHALAHEAYHSNEGQHLQRCRLPLGLFKSLFTPSLREQFPDDVQRTIVKMATIAKPIVADFSNTPHVPHLKDMAQLMHRLHTKLDEGAADVHACMVLMRTHPDIAMNFTVMLAEERQRERTLADSSSTDEFVKAYDNASCLKALIDTSWEQWPTDSLGCTVFSLLHTVPFMKKEPQFLSICDDLDRMALHFQKNYQRLTVNGDPDEPSNHPDTVLNRRPK